MARHERAAETAPIVSPYDELADAYDQHFTDAKSLAENRAVAAALRVFLRPGDRVVDLGCGTGLLLDLVPLASDRYVGVDISAGMLARARAKHPGHRFLLGDMERPVAGLQDASADVVVSLFGSMSYCDLERTRDRVRQLLRPGGRYFLMLCGPRYPRRPSFIDQGSGGLRPHPAARVCAAYRPDTARGMSWLIDWLPSWLPRRVFDAVIRVERATVGRLAPDACYFLVITGTFGSSPGVARPLRAAARGR